MKYADLHVHTNFSDGTFSPEKVVKTAYELGLSAIAICDHDCVDGLAPAIKEAKKYPIEIIPGVELTVIERGKEIHILGYCMAWRERWFRNILKRIQRERITRLDKMLEKLKKFDINLERKRVIDIAGNKGSVGRLHLARALFETKAVSSLQMAFNKYIGDFKPCYVEDIGFEAQEAVDVILKAKGVPVLAHPSVIGDDEMVQKLIKCGVRGIEIYHSKHSKNDSAKYKKLAEDYNILPVGGSDCHGMGKGRILMGSVKVEYDVVEKLKEEAEIIKKR